MLPTCTVSSGLREPKQASLAHYRTATFSAVKNTYERTLTRLDGLQGFRVGIDPDGMQGLQANLPPDLFETVECALYKAPSKTWATAPLRGLDGRICNPAQ